MKRQIAAVALVGTLALVGCMSQPADTADDTPVVEDTAAEEEPEEVVEEEAEPEVKTAAVGEQISYAANTGGQFLITVDGLEWSQRATENSGFGDGYCMGFLLFKLTNDGVDTSTPSMRLGRMWLEDSDGVTLTPANTGFSYGEYGLGFDYSFELYEDGQTVRVAVPFMLREGSTDYTAVVDGVRVPLTLTEGDRPIA
ncbi:hypothetical protein [Thermophilibacter provencensis]|uniref:DUF4352 domain-containing protein n=1 Tax=Thermophilibacter provencensis TaxID=1852386 RepID=A0ABT7V1U7_9ACTN|nr:hypothetical protein [Thermophilibacter provencensis]MDM8270588.1 hypothetical protein [Thermophilibacter provencensis]